MAEEFEMVELEYSEDDILYYLVDEDDNEVGFVIEEDGREVECYYEGFDADDYVLEDRANEMAATQPTSESAPAADDAEPGYFAKLVAIAGHEGGKARDAASAKLEKAREAAAPKVEAAKKTAGEQIGKAKVKAATKENDLGITRESVQETTADLNAIAKEGAEAAKELKEAYDDIMENVGWLLPKGARRRLP